MIEIERTSNGELSLDVLATSDRPGNLPATEIIRLAWRHDLRPKGSLHPLEILDLRLLDVVRLAATGLQLSPAQFADLIERNPTVSDADSDAIAAAATVALRDPPLMRWISANATTVARSTPWSYVVGGLGGLTVSVPLAEEALGNLVRAKTKPSQALGESVQLNVWFSRRFAARFRRRAGAKRVRVRERGATVRAWSHARTSLGHLVPFEWSSRHGRGVGRSLDDWSIELLTEYVDAFENTFPDGVPPAIASLYAIAAGAIHHEPATSTVASAWDLLPLNVENRARKMVGMGSVDIAEADTVALNALAELFPVGHNPIGS